MVNSEVLTGCQDSGWLCCELTETTTQAPIASLIIPGRGSYSLDYCFKLLTGILLLLASRIKPILTSCCGFNTQNNYTWFAPQAEVSTGSTFSWMDACLYTWTGSPTNWSQAGSHVFSLQLPVIGTGIGMGSEHRDHKQYCSMTLTLNSQPVHQAQNRFHMYSKRALVKHGREV